MDYLDSGDQQGIEVNLTFKQQLRANPAPQILDSVEGCRRELMSALVGTGHSKPKWQTLRTQSSRHS